MKLAVLFILSAVVALTAGKPVSEEAATAIPNTAEPTTVEPNKAEPTTAEPNTAEPNTAEPNTAESNTAEPTTVEPTTAEPNTAEPTTVEPTTAEPITLEPTTAVPAAVPSSPSESIRVVERVVVLAAPEDVLVRDLEEEILREEEEMEDEVEAGVVLVRPLIAEGRHARCRLVRQSYPSRRRQGFQQPFVAARPRPQPRPFRPRPAYLRPVQEEPPLQIVF